MTFEDDDDDLNYNEIYQDGGKKIGEGGYGCVYYPAMDCEGKRERGKPYISKLQVDGFAAKNEVYVGKLIKNIPNYKRYFAPVISYCKVNKSNLKENGVIDNCAPLTYRRESNIVMMKIDRVKGVEFNEIIRSDIKPKKLLNIIIKSYNYLLRSVSTLVKNKIVHYDLKSPNIMYDTEKGIPYIIDFGLSIPINVIGNNEKILLQDYFYTYSPEYYLWCPEIHMMSLIAINGSIDERLIQIVCEESLENHPVLSNIFFKHQFIAHIMSTVKFYIKKFRELKSSSVNFANYLLETYYTWDAYSLAIMFLDIVKVIKKNKRYDKNGRDFINLFTRLLLQSVYYNPEKRVNPVNLDEYLLHYHRKNKGKGKGIDIFDGALKDIERNTEHIQNKLIGA